jgi:hypothetical protein
VHRFIAWMLCLQQAAEDSAEKASSDAEAEVFFSYGAASGNQSQSLGIVMGL